MTHQFDQYAQGIIVKDKSGTELTPSTVTDVSVRIGDTVYSYSEGTLVYSTTDEKWYALLTQEQTAAMTVMDVQAEGNFGSDPIFTTKSRILHSDVERERLDPSLDWSDDE